MIDDYGPLPPKKKGGKGLRIALGILAAIVVLNIIFSEKKDPEGGATATRVADTDQPAVPVAKSKAADNVPVSQMVFVRDVIGCKDWDTWKRMGQVVAQGDREAFARILGPALRLGTCRRFNTGDIGFLSDTAIFSASSCIRPKGDIACFWTSIDATERP